MSKELAQALANWIAQTNQVIEQIAESHYWDGSSNRQVKVLHSHGRALIEAIHEAAKPGATVPPLAPAPPIVA